MSRFHKYADQFMRAPLEQVDPFVGELVELEESRQDRKMILIPSESICPKPVREALASPFTNVYAEGYPPRLMEGAVEEEIRDLEWQLINYRRYADRRFYKGCEYVDEIESLARHRAGQCFAGPNCPAHSIHVNVQPLSGSAANNAVYEAFLEPGDLIMGLSLQAGGHLTHGSEFNRSGKRYRVVSYGVGTDNGRLDYDEILELAKQHRPRLIVAGYTSYPWAPDWTRFRKIADEGGAILLADIAHPAGLVAAGQYPNPLGIADVVTFTTHKTLCGPRGAVIMTTDPAVAERVNMAVFPGEQGGPHVNKMAAMAVAFRIAQTQAFRNLQKGVVDNAAALAKALESRGLKLCYGGTNTHLLVLDIRNVGQKTGYPILGEIAARILDLAGIVVNKNTIPGDQSAADARGIRMGTPWVTQRGMGPEEMDAIADITHRLLSEIRPFTYEGVASVLSRGKLPMRVLERARRDVQDLLEGLYSELPRWEYPHDHGLYPMEEPRGSAVSHGDDQVSVSNAEVVVEDHTDKGVIEVRGERAWAFLQEMCTQNLTRLSSGEACEALILDEAGRYMDAVTVLRENKETFYVLTHRSKSQEMSCWFRRIAEGYVLFDPDDILIKVQGPVGVRDRSRVDIPEPQRLVAFAIGGEGARAFWEEGPGCLCFALEGGPRRVILMSPDRAGTLWRRFKENPRVATIDPSTLDDRRRERGFPDQTDEEPPEAFKIWQDHPEWFDLNKPYFVGLWSLREIYPKSGLERFVPPSKPENLSRSCLHQEHVRLAKKMAPFAGWEMPIWYRSIQEEHQEVRTRAGLFDITHMGVIGIEGDDGPQFLDLITTNYVRWLRIGEIQYSFMLDPEGGVIDDLIVYRVGPQQYFVVVNASNQIEDLAWMQAVAQGGISMDLERPGMRFKGEVRIRNLKEPASGDGAMVDMALQGPASLMLLLRLAAKREDRWRLRALKKTELTRASVGNIPVVISRTGYTGEPMGFEIFVHPDSASQLWQDILGKGEDLGVVPAGLGARDSLRTEAGLPLHGHELAGPHDIDPMMAGFGAYVKLHKPFFVGRSIMVERAKEIKRRIVRFRLTRRGARMLHPGDLVVHRRNNQVLGWVTSSALAGDGVQVGMALVDARFERPETPIALVPKPGKSLSEATGPGDRWPLHEEGVVVDRFMTQEESKRDETYFHIGSAGS